MRTLLIALALMAATTASADYRKRDCEGIIVAMPVSYPNWGYVHSGNTGSVPHWFETHGMSVVGFNDVDEGHQLRLNPDGWVTIRDFSKSKTAVKPYFVGKCGNAYIEG